MANVKKVVDYVVDEQEIEHTVSVGYVFQRHGYQKLVLSIDCFGVDPIQIRSIPSLDDQVKDIIRSREGEETEFDYDKITMI